MILDTALYKLVKNAFAIISDAYSKMAVIAEDAIDAEKGPKQPRLLAQLIEVGALFDQVTSHVVFNAGGTAIIGIQGEDVSVINHLILCLKRAAGLNNLSLFPVPLTTIIVTVGDSGIHWIDCGTFDASAGLPSTGGTGDGGLIEEGNTFDVLDLGGNVGGTIDGVYYPPGTTFRALRNNPTTVAHYRIYS